MQSVVYSLRHGVGDTRHIFELVNTSIFYGGHGLEMPQECLCPRRSDAGDIRQCTRERGSLVLLPVIGHGEAVNFLLYFRNEGERAAF